MTLEYAIRLARKWAFGGVCSLREGEAQEYHKMALAALEDHRDGAAPAWNRRALMWNRKAWEKPCGMCGGGKILYQKTNTTKLFMNTFGKAATLVTECEGCPPIC